MATKPLVNIAARVADYQNEYGISIGKAFMMWYAIEILGLETTAAYEAVSFDGGNDEGIDFFYVHIYGSASYPSA
jgi:hypothetical protein